MPDVVIGMSGKARHGKSSMGTLIEAYAKACGYVAESVGFADAVKAEARERFGWNGEKDEAGRTLLQKLGMDRRKENPDYWVERLFERIKSDVHAPFLKVYIITDVRFENEASAIRHLPSGMMWRVFRVNATGLPYENDLTAEQRGHPSETALDSYKFDHVFVSKNIRGLMSQVEVELKALLGQESGRNSWANDPAVIKLLKETGELA